MKKNYEKRQSYLTDLTDEQWLEIAPLFVGMQEYKYSKRELVNAVLYLVDNGCKCRGLPHEFPRYSIVHSIHFGILTQRYNAATTQNLYTHNTKNYKTIQLQFLRKHKYLTQTNKKISFTYQYNKEYKFL